MKDYRQAWKAIQPLVDFRIDWRSITPSQKRQIRIYDRERKSLEARGAVVIRTNTRNRKQIQQEAQHAKGFPRFKVAFVPATQNAKVRVKNGHLVISENALERRTHLFPRYEKKPGEHITDPLAVVKRILARDKKSVKFVIITGKYEDFKSYPRKAELIAEGLANYIGSYGNHEKWLKGLIGYSFSNQADYNDYRDSRKLAKEKKRKKRKPPKGRENER